MNYLTAYERGVKEGTKSGLYTNPYPVGSTERTRYEDGYTVGAKYRGQGTAATVFREIPKTSRRGRMSDDRVLFFLRAAHLQDYRYVTVLKNTLGLTQPNIDKLLSIASPRAGNGVDSHGVRIICRPSQFTRFLIRRNEAGKQNQFKELNPSIFYPALVGMPEQWDVDVSRNPA